ncbi:MAG: fatty acid kinase fatty acid binding subunit, partial [Mycobacterium sp.]|nr:fatty acid kinase fatty acid binding subunit [Mycobacterium sp.]
MAVMVVTDSSARLDPDELQRWGIRQVPLHVLVDGTDLRDGIDPVPYDIHDRAHVTTAGAAPADLTEAYRKALADSGGDGVVAVHLSAALSSTFSTAAAAAREFGPAVRVVNARSAAAGVG